MFSILCAVTFLVLPDFSSTRWLSLWSLLCDMTVMCSFHNVFIYAIRYALDLAMDENGQHGDLSEISDAELRRLPQVDPKAWSKQEGRRALKVLRWIESPGTLHHILLWLHVAQPVMHLHASLLSIPLLLERRSRICSLCATLPSLSHTKLWWS